MNTETPEEILQLLLQHSKSAFSDTEQHPIEEIFSSVINLFLGKSKGFEPADTGYHSLNHTLQAALCYTRLITGRMRVLTQPKITYEGYVTGLTAILFHDTGYIKTKGDIESTGAKYALIHENRSIETACYFLRIHKWPKPGMERVIRLIQSTSLKVNFSDISYTSEEERILGQAVCSADLVAQFSDPDYEEKLAELYQEMKTTFIHQGIPPNKHPVPSYEALLKGTPAFVENCIATRLEKEAESIWKYLADPETGYHHEREQIEQNLKKIRKRYAR